MQSDELKIVFCFDKKYIEYARASIKSLLKNKTRNVFIYIIFAGSENDDLSSITNLIAAFDSGFKIFYVDYAKLEFCKPMEHLLMPTYLRLLIPSLVQEKKIIYIDCDTYINQDLGELFDLDLRDNILAVAPDDHRQDLKDRLNLKSENYSNAGVLRWDLEKINRQSFLEECKNIYAKKEKDLSFGDQCILNIIYDNRKITIASDWNEQVIVNYAYYPVLEYFIEHKRKIIHFCGPVKPWECAHGSAGWKFWHRYMI